MLEIHINRVGSGGVLGSGAIFDSGGTNGKINAPSAKKVAQNM